MQSNQNQQTIELRDYWRIVVKRKWFLIFPFVITALLVTAGSYYLQPTYESSTTILVAESHLLSSTFSRMMPENRHSMSREQRQERINTIRNRIVSTDYLSQLVERLGLPVPQSIKEAVIELHSKFPDISELELARKMQVESLRRTISVSFNGSNLVQIAATASSPQLAADKARTLADIFIENSLASELTGVEGALVFSDEMLDTYRKRLEESEAELRRFEQEMLRRNMDQDSTMIRNIDQINTAIDATNIEIKSISKTIGTLRDELEEHGIDQPRIDYSSNLASLKFDALESISGLSGLLVRYSWRDAQVVRINERSREYLQEIENEIESLVVGQFPEREPIIQQKLIDYEYLSIKLSFLKEKRRVLYEAVRNVQSQIAESPALTQRHEALQRKVEENRRIYELFSEQLTGSQINQAATRAEAETKFKIIEPAAIPLKPVSPNRVKLAAVGAVLGLALGLGIILLLELWDNSFHKVEEVESYLGLKVVGTVPRLKLPLSQKGSGRIWIIMGITVSTALVAFIIYLSRTVQ
ncbi:MAG: hypothetical protein GF315_09305 [candidate division Zixibacteria bacterium]|nr:hypothetical protein [candidate division Zixibacteria bacterium]